jgi:hypothetical protein
MLALERLTADDDAPVYHLRDGQRRLGTIRQRYGVWLLHPPGQDILAASTDLDRLVSKAAALLVAE